MSKAGAGARLLPAADAFERAAALLGSDPAAAERSATALLRQQPGDPRGRLILASALRRRGDLLNASAILEPLARQHPAAARTQYEIGLVLGALGEGTAATDALRRSVALQREQPQAWAALGEALFRSGDVRGAQAAYAEQLRASVQAPELKAAADALAADDPAGAELLIGPYLLRRPADTAALRMMGETLGRLHRYADAETVLDDALRRDPGFDGARFTLAGVLFHQQRAVEAAGHLRDLLAREPENAAYRNLLAACLSLVGEPEEVEALHRGLLLDYPDQAQVWLNHGHALRTVRRFPEAVEAYRRAIRLQPAFGDAYWALANLKLAGLADEEAGALRRELARPELRRDDRLPMHYALGKALEERGEDQAAFESYAAGAKLRHATERYSADATSADVNERIGRLTAQVFAEREGGGAPARDPIFIVGLPRSGSTLVEQILASHPSVEGTMELPDLGLIAGGLGAATGGGLDALLELDGAGRRRLGERYLEATRVHRKLGRAFFTDKMPNNFRHLGLIALALPHARVIDVRRHPMAAGWAVFKQHFAQGQGFSYDLVDIGRYYHDYVRLMAHFDTVLPGRVRRLIYEDLVQDTEGEVRALLTHCGLPFDPACLRFHENGRPVKTVSSEQVRRPIFRDGLEQWRRFEPWLEPLRDALGPALEGWRG